MNETGTLRKMIVEDDTVVKYWMNLDKNPVIQMDTVVGSEIKLAWTGNIYCINCGKSIQKTFGQGFCYTCFTESAQAAPCIIRPELCEAHLGKGRDVEYEEANHNKPHFVYLAQTSGIKVGVTRSTQIPTRWIDQGAWRAAVIAEVPYRQMAGLIEIELKQYLSDRTDWRKMLIDERDDDNLMDVCNELISFLPKENDQYAAKEIAVREFTYPVLEYPKKIKSLKLEDRKELVGELVGIRGQYLYFKGGNVINMRKYSGFEVTVEV